jgi:hypothetical protein
VELIVILLLVTILFIKHRRKAKHEEEKVLQERDKAIEWYREQIFRKKEKVIKDE